MKKNGFTLIELLLYVSIAGVMLLVISVFLSSLLGARIKNQTISEVEQQGMQVMQLITQTTRNAAVVNSPSAGTSAASLSVDTLTAGNNPTIFDLSGGAVRIKEGAAAAVALTNSRITVSGLTFSSLSAPSTPGTIRIQFTISAVNSSGRNEYSYSKQFNGSATLYWP